MINSLRLEDYKELQVFKHVIDDAVTFIQTQVPQARVDIGHEHRYWEYCTAIKLYMEHTAKIPDLLDVGSGYSPFSVAMALKLKSLKHPAIVTVCDPSAEAIANSNLINCGITPGIPTLKLENVGTDNLPLHRYDMVTCISVLEHVDKAIEWMSWEELALRVEPGGILFITVDCVPETKPFGYYHFDNLRNTNYTPAMIKERVDNLLKNFDMMPIGKVDYIYHGDFVHNYTFFRIGLMKKK